MSDQLPAPLVPAGVILRDFAYMPLDVVRLRDSRLVVEVSAEAFRCAVMLWCVSWHQVPAGSLPDDDLLLAGYAGFGRSTREWLKHRAGALHGWVKCSDGRLYHPVVAEKAIEAQLARDMQAYKTECARIKKAAQRGKFDAEYPTFEEWHKRKLETGNTKWDAIPAPVVPVPVPRTKGQCPEMSRSNRREGKGREGISNTPSSNISASIGITERAERLARAFSVEGFEVEADSDLIRRLGAQGVSEGEVSEAAKAANGWLRRKPLNWVIARIEGKRDDVRAPPGIAAVAAVDPRVTARRQADSDLQDALIDSAHMERLGLYTPERKAERDAAARAAHSAALAALGVAS